MPSPADMPGAATDTKNVDPADAAPEQGDDAGDNADTDDELDAVVADPQAEIARLRGIVRKGRKFEDRARKNADKARLWDENQNKVKDYDELVASQQTEAQKDKARADKLEADLAAERLNGLRKDIAAELKVPARFVTGTTETEMRDAAEEYISQRDADIEARLKELGVNPAAPASAVTSDGKGNEVKQLTRAEISGMSKKDILAAEKAGQLDDALGRTR